MILEQRLRGGEGVRYVTLSGEKAFQPEGTASAKVLRRDCLGCSGATRRPLWLGQREGESKRFRLRFEGWDRFLPPLGGHYQDLGFYFE